MAVLQKVADAQAAAASISLSGVGIVAGDIVVIHAYRSGSTTPPSSPGANWTDISTSTGANTNSRRIGYRVIQAADNLATISGTWTNATAIQFIALRGQHLTTPIGGTGSGGSNTSTLTTPAVTMSVTDGTSWVIAFAGSKSTNANTVTLSSTTDEGSSQGALNLATGRSVSSYASRAYSATVNASGNRMDAVEIEQAPPVSSSFTASAVVRDTNTGSFTANAVLLKTGTGSFTASALLLRTSSQTFTANAVVFGTRTAGLTVNAAIGKSGSGTFSVDAVLKWTKATSLTADAFILGNTVTGSFRVDANTRPGPDGPGILLDAFVAAPPVTASFTADATIRRTQSGSFTASAIVKATRSGSFTADAFLFAAGAGSFTANAVVFRSAAGSFTADAFVSLATSGSFRLDAVKLKTQAGSLTANAAIRSTRAASFTIDAAIGKTWTASFTSDANFAFLRTGSFTADALPRITGTGSFTVDYATWSGVGPPPPLIGVPTKIFINGTEYTNNIIWKTAQFTSKVNTGTGECSFDILDRSHSLSFQMGDEIQLYIDGILRWGGWVLQSTRTFPFPMMKSPLIEPRIWHIGGVDYNRFMDRRILHDSAHPNRTWNYAAGTNDDIILNDLWNYFDTAGFTKNFQHVADGVLDIPGVTARTGGNIAQGGFSMRDVLMHLSWDTGAIYYVTPTRVVTYVDADLVSNPYTLTDQPSGPLDVGFHDLKILEDSTEMVNDSIIWGAGKGSANVVVSRYQSSAGQTAHGRWQSGDFTPGIYKQATADAVARAAVEGSPQSLRGAKNPKRAVELLTWEPVFGIGDVVHFHDSQFFLPPAQIGDAPTHDDVLPIRTMTVTWPTPYQPLFALQLSWEVDAVWSFYDPWLPVGAAGIGSGGGVGIGGSQDPPSGGCDCGSTSTGITDTFNRTLATGWGTSDSGATWSTTYDSITYVDGSQGILTATGTPNLPHSLPGYVDIMAPLTLFRSGSGSILTGLLLEYDGTFNSSVSVGVVKDNTDTRMRIDWYYDYEYGATDFQSGSFYLTGSSNGSKIWVRVYANGTDYKAKAWLDGSAEPSSWQIEITTTLANPITSTGNLGVQGGNLNVLPGSTLAIDALSIAGVDRCTAVQFDDFNRTVASGWGIATPSGFAWTNEDSGSTSVNGAGHMQMTNPSNAEMAMLSVPPYLSAGTTWTMRTHFFVDYVDSTHTPELRFEAWNGGVSARCVLANDGNGGVYIVDNTTGLVGSFFSMDFAANTGYTMVWSQVYNGTSELKVWADGDAEPAFQVTGTSHVTFTNDIFHVKLNDAGGTVVTVNLTLDYIDFDYAGKPCYPCASNGAKFDDFDNRTISLTSDYTGWGTPSGLSEPYNTDVLIGFDNNNQSQIGVAGGVGQIRTALCQASLFNIYPNMVGFRGFNFANWPLTMPDGTSMPITYELKFRINGTLPGDVMTPDGLCSWTLNLLWTTTQNTTVELGINPHAPDTPTWDGSGKGGQFTIWGPGWGGDPPDRYRHKTDWEADVWYHLRVESGIASSFAWLWKEGDAMGTPIGGSHLTNFSTGYNEIDINANDASYPAWGSYPGNLDSFFGQPENTWPTISIDVDYLTWDPPFALDGCVTPTAGGSGVPAGTRLTERLTPLSTPVSGAYASGSLWQATNSILPGTALIAITNVVQNPSLWTIYDANAGQFQINEVVIVGDIVTTVYITNGPLA